MSRDEPGSLQIGEVRRRLASGEEPADVVADVYDRLTARGQDATWISIVPRDAALARAAELGPDDGTRPLYGVPFAIKDNIDVAGMETTAACPDFAYVPENTATVVTRLEAAGAILIGKTNLDQFATGLNGTRSPYGAPENPFDPDLIPGGSSSGSAVAVAAGLVSFAIGTDTAGSGRVPAGLTSTVGIKPTRGLVSTAGVLPACRSLDCVSIFALGVADGAQVLAAIAGPDAADPWSRELAFPAPTPGPVDLKKMTLGIPDERSLGLADEYGYAAAWQAVIGRLRALDVRLVEVDLGPFFEAGSLLYGGAWIAERYAGLAEFVDSNAAAVHPVVAALLAAGKDVTAADAFRSIDRLQVLRARAASSLAGVDALVTPTSPTTFSVAQMEAEPIDRNAILGRYSTFVNLLDLAAVALPAGMATPSAPFGVTLHGPAGSDARLAALAAGLEAEFDAPVGATGAARVPASGPSAAAVGAVPVGAPSDAAAEAVVGTLDLAVVGAHLAGMPLHEDLLSRGATLVAETHTTPEYRLYALPDTTPAKPGMVRVPRGGEAIAVEVYRMPLEQWGSFVATVPEPLAIGTVRLADGTAAHGFVCEGIGVSGGEDITSYGGWRAYCADRGL